MSYASFDAPEPVAGHQPHPSGSDPSQVEATATPSSPQHPLSFLANILKPSPPQHLSASALPVPYDGYEFHFRNFIIRPALFKLEGVILALIVVYYLIGLSGSRSNARRARSWIQAQSALVEDQFADPGRGSGLESYGSTLYYTWWTGRRNLLGADVQILLRSRHDLITRLLEEATPLVQVGTKVAEDRVVLDLQLPRSKGPQDDVVFAVVDKGAMRSLRTDRWDLRTFTTTNDHQALPGSHALMSEMNDVTNWFLGSAAGGKTAAAAGTEGTTAVLTQLMKKSPESMQWLDSIILSGEPVSAPDPELILKDELPTRSRHLTLTIRLPPSGREAETTPLLEAALNIVDLLVTRPPTLTSDAMNKIKKRRQEASDALTATLRKEAAEEAEEKRRERRKKEDEDKRKGMSEAQRRELDEKRKRREQRKAGGKAGKMMR